MYAVIFTSQRTDADPDGYAVAAERMEALAEEQPGYVGIESVRGPDGMGVTVSYWATAADAAAWGRHPEHVEVQRLGRERWYAWFRLHVCRVEATRTFPPAG